jgi:spore maturation protein B
MEKISSLIIPFIVLIVIIYGIIKKTDVYDSFVMGAKESFPMILTMFPSMLAMVFGVNIFVKSGFLEFILSFLKPLISYLKIPVEVITLAFLRPISGSSALAFLNNILNTYGADSFVGNLASIIQGSTDTTFYILTLYFGSVGIKKIRYSMLAGLLADLAGVLAAFILANIYF